MSAFLKDLFREIKNSMGRFVSLLIITALGAMSVVGIQAASIDMRAIADKTYKGHNIYDIQIKSTAGFDVDDITALENTHGIASVMPTTVFDAYIGIAGENRAARTYALPEGINEIEILEGRLPTGGGECAVERRILEDGDISIGDSVWLSMDNMDEFDEAFTNESFTVVGVVSSPLYISLERGNTTMGDGKLHYYMYLHPDAYTLDVYTDVYLLMDGSQGMDNLADDYHDAADGWKLQAEQTGEIRVHIREAELADTQIQIDDGWLEYFDGLNELEEKTEDGRRELEEAKIELDDAKSELERGQITLDEGIADGLDEIDRQHEELISSQNELNARRAELEAAQVQIDEARAQLDETLAGLALMGPQGVSQELDAHYEQTYFALGQLVSQQAEIDEGISALSSAQIRLDGGFLLIDDARIELEEERLSAQAVIDDGWFAYYKGLAEYNEGVMTLETEEADALVELAGAKRDLEEAQEALDGAPTPEWFYFTRKDGLAFDSYYQDTLRLQKIGYVFPMVFFLVAVLVSLTTMSRMVEDHRTQIGIYKALGYRPAAIMLKYLVYAFSASVIGGLAGVAAGSRLLPLVIADAYGHLYNLPPIETPIPVAIAIIAVVSAVLSVVLVTLATCAGSMSDSPASLMRPKPPAKGKRVWMEKTPLLWNRLNFFAKVTARNIFRYKRRFIMTLIGVAGCAALLLTAFGLRDSIGGVADMQYGSIMEYDARVYLKDIDSPEKRAELNAVVPEAHLYIREEAISAAGANGGLPASLVVPDTLDGVAGYINLYDPDTGVAVTMGPESILVSDKLARVMGVSAGDSFSVTYSDGKAYTLTATGIIDNYVQHFVYMSPDIYSTTFGGEPHPNSALLLDENADGHAATLLENGNVRAVVYNDDLAAGLADSTDAMGIVTIVLIVLACALALVVLFNLTNINISERIRELATIKVLGFNDMELALYIYRENGAVTMLGIALGIIGGYFLHGFVLTTVEIDLVKFPQLINSQSYILAAALSLTFAVFVNFASKFRLNRIDMVESLKNVE